MLAPAAEDQEKADEAYERDENDADADDRVLKQRLDRVGKERERVLGRVGALLVRAVGDAVDRVGRVRVAEGAVKDDVVRDVLQRAVDDVAAPADRDGVRHRRGLDAVLRGRVQQRGADVRHDPGRVVRRRVVEPLG